MSARYLVEVEKPCPWTKPLWADVVEPGMGPFFQQSGGIALRDAHGANVGAMNALLHLFERFI
jgi:hypothetical protein